MCIAILNINSTLSYETVYNSFENNSDGAGILYILNGKLKAYKQAKFDPSLFYSVYCDLRSKTNLPIVLHFRIGTHGDFSEHNLHPFFVDKNNAFVHNGIIQNETIKNDKSDTWHFNEYFLKRIVNKKYIYEQESFESFAIKKEIGTYNKLIFLNNVGVFSIYNERSGHWDASGNWFSNDTYKPSLYKDYGGIKIEKTKTKSNSKKATDFDTLYLEEIANEFEISVDSQEFKDYILEIQFQTGITEIEELYDYILTGKIPASMEFHENYFDKQNPQWT